MNKILEIDLLNKIANGEEAPKKIKKNNDIYEYNEEYKYYKKENQWGGGSLGFNINSLNDEIEIIEEPKKIEKISTLILGETENNKYAYDIEQIRADIDVLARQLNIITEKQCEIIDYINELEK